MHRSGAGRMGLHLPRRSRARPGVDAFGDEFQIVLETEGVLDSFTIVVETRALTDGSIAGRLSAELEAAIIRQCELRPRIRVVAPGTLPPTEFKARRVIDRRIAL